MVYVVAGDVVQHLHSKRRAGEGARIKFHSDIRTVTVQRRQRLKLTISVIITSATSEGKVSATPTPIKPSQSNMGLAH